MSALGKDAPDEFWDAYDTATGTDAVNAGGEPYVNAVKRMADLASK